MIIVYVHGGAVGGGLMVWALQQVQVLERLSKEEALLSSEQRDPNS